MPGRVAYRISRALLPLAELISSDSWASLPRPSESRLIVRAAGAEADRILLAGNSLAVGWGVVSHDLALAGTLARATAAATGRGVDVDVHVRPDKTTRMVERFLTPSTASRYDAIVLALGTREAFTRIPLRLWRRHLDRLLDHVAGLPSPPPVVVVGADEITPVPLREASARRAIGRVRALNAATRELVRARAGAAFAESAVVSTRGTGCEFMEHDKPELFERMAATIAPVLTSVLRPELHREREPIDEEGRLEAIATARSRLDSDDPELIQIVKSARDLFGAADAVLLLVESDAIHPIVADESVVRVPHKGSFSAETIQHPQGFVVPDVLADERFRDRPDVTGPPYLRSYAGHRVESPDGHPVAVLAVGDTRPREFGSTDLALLRALAHRAGEALFRPSS